MNKLITQMGVPVNEGKQHIVLLFPLKYRGKIFTFRPAQLYSPRTRRFMRSVLQRCGEMVLSLRRGLLPRTVRQRSSMFATVWLRRMAGKVSARGDTGRECRGLATESGAANRERAAAAAVKPPNGTPPDVDTLSTIPRNF